MASARVFSPLQICWYHSLSRNWEQKIVEDFLRLLCISSKRFLASSTKGTDYVSLVAIGCTGNKEVSVFCDIFTGCKTADQRFIQLSSRMIINRCNAGIRLFKLSLTNQPFLTIIFTIGVSHINKHTKTLFKRYVFHCAIIHLNPKCILIFL